MHQYEASVERQLLLLTNPQPGTSGKQRSITRKQQAETGMGVHIELPMIVRDIWSSLDDDSCYSFLLRATGAKGLIIYNQDREGIIKGTLSQSLLVQAEALVKEVARTGKIQKKVLSLPLGIFLPQKQILVVAVPIPGKDKSTGRAVGVAIPLSKIFAASIDSYVLISLYLLVNLLVLTVFGFIRFAKIIIRPVEKLVTMTDSYQEEGGLPFFSDQSTDEFGQLSRSLNRMLERIKRDQHRLQQHVDSLEAANAEIIATRNEMVRAEKLASVGRLAAGLAHEIGNPIGVVQGFLGLLRQDDLSDDERKEFVKRSEKELERINSLVRELLDFSRVRRGEKQEISIHEIVKNVIAMMQAQPAMQDVALKIKLKAGADKVLANPDQVQQVFLNCLFNGVDALRDKTSGKKLIIIKTENVTDESGQQYIRICLQDNGTGMDKNTLSKVFDPFFTTKEPGKGTGLGLSVVHSLIQEMGGSITLESSPGSGTAVILLLPLAEAMHKSGAFQEKNE